MREFKTFIDKDVLLEQINGKISSLMVMKGMYSGNSDMIKQSNIAIQLLLDDVFDYVHKLKDLKDKLVFEIMSTDDENRRKELAQEVHKITNYCAWVEHEENFMAWYQYYRYGESPPHIDWMKVITEICGG